PRAGQRNPEMCLGPITAAPRVSAEPERLTLAENSSRADLQEIAQQLRPLERQEALGVELHAVQRKGAVPHPHDLVLVGPGRDDEVGIAERVALDDEAVVAGRLERVGKAGKDALVIVMDQRSLAVHDAVVTHDLAAERVADALMAQADAERRYRCG